MGNKYRRLVWDKVCSCIHTRNDVLSSQDTIHPTDNRVLSIRELMRVMTIPDSFHWTSYDDSVTVSDADAYLKANELNIRRCIGEAVPTQIMKNIAYKINLALEGATNQVDFFNSIKNLEISGESIKVKTNDFKSLNDYLPQIASYFADRTNLEIHCFDFSDDEITVINQLVAKWDWIDFIKIIPENERKTTHISFHLSLDGALLKRTGIQLSLF